MTKKALPLKVFLAILLNDVSDSFAQLLMKKGLPDAAAPAHFQNLAVFFSHSASSPFVWLGVLIYASNFFIWMIILSKADLSVALPAGSASYAIIPILAVIFLKESLAPLTCLGILLIIAGVHF